jgi:16S rRNA (cytosine1402-N4)-methyltransferase
VVHAAFSNLKTQLAALNVPLIDGLLLDLGVSSPQLDEAARGFSFRFDAPLDMRMDTSPQSPSMTAAQWLNSATQQQISQVIFEYGEERGAAKIAANIVLARQTKAIQTTAELAQLVQATVKSRKPGQHSATRTFQAIRIHINQELAELENVLDHAQAVVRDGGRISIISFHSLEDRLVKQRFRAQPVSVALRHLPREEVLHPWLELERIKPSEQECKANARARSAVLRVAQRQVGQVAS